MSEGEKFDDATMIKGQVVVGFDKGVSQKDAEILLDKYNLKYEKTDDVNMGKVFFYETGEKYIVEVPKGQESEWLNKLKQEKQIKIAGFYIDPNKILID